MKLVAKRRKRRGNRGKISLNNNEDFKIKEKSLLSRTSEVPGGGRTLSRSPRTGGPVKMLAVEAGG